MKTPETIQKAENELKYAKRELDNAESIVINAKVRTQNAEEALAKARNEQEKANKKGQEFLEFCHGGETRHDFVLIQMNTEDKSHFERRVVGYDRPYRVGSSSYYDMNDCCGEPIFDTVYVPGPKVVSGQLECKHCGANVALTNA